VTLPAGGSPAISQWIQLVSSERSARRTWRRPGPIPQHKQPVGTQGEARTGQEVGLECLGQRPHGQGTGGIDQPPRPPPAGRKTPRDQRQEHVGGIGPRLSVCLEMPSQCLWLTLKRSGGRNPSGRLDSSEAAEMLTWARPLWCSPKRIPHHKRLPLEDAVAGRTD
jgi:hypothetical protein